MNRIEILDESVSNIIAAGEVVENPASMVKELLENSLDAKGNSIIITVKNSGRYVKIKDNGIGMNREDLFLSVERHATSKISSKDDIFALTTYGFRGEALASISAVSKVTLTSKEENSNGHMIRVTGGKVTKFEEIATNRGTEIEIKDLFYNTPARLKFLRKKTTEYTRIREIVLKEALVNPEVAITLILDNRVAIKTTGKGIENTILDLFGKTTLKNIKKFDYGYFGNMNILKSSKDHIYTYVNSRYVKSKIIEEAVIDGYYTKLVKGKYPFAIIFLEVDPSEVDVNVHPSKKIVKFSNGKHIYDMINSSIDEAIHENEKDNMPAFEFEEENATEKVEEKLDSLIDFSDFKEFISKPSKKIEEKTSFKTNFISEKPKLEKQALISQNEVIKSDFYKQEDLNYEVFKKGTDEKPKKLELEKIPESFQEIVESKEVELEVDLKEETVEKQIKKPKPEEVKHRIIGQLNNMFILVESEFGLEIYDQHIVQERILYEKLKTRYETHEIVKQNLLIPQKINIEYREREAIRENIELFEEFGFEIEEFGDSEILIRTVPVFDFRTSVEENFRDILKRIMSGKTTDPREEIFISMSCKNSIKAGERLSYEEMKLLIEELHTYGKYTCPHGRPIILKMPFLELEKKFKRR